ncbi:MAG: cytochrome c [Proteobacteria bacterium]|nr:cytochrome c [Cystobacterineae bacterium]MCL2258291.1 cytochrome c [Cystobacterineae bacterium]MCL2315065.1 cytochrome c [Pseudomonadota bacterium]
MSIARIGCFIGCLVFVGVLACGQDVSKPNYEYSPDMAYSLAYESFSANPHLPAGRTLAVPPQGTVPQGYQPFHYEPTAEEALRAGMELRDMLPRDKVANEQILERGNILFTRLCVPCHAMDMQGGGLVTRLFSRPPSLLASSVVDMKDGQLFHIITKGHGSMPSYEQQISQQDRWKVIRYIRAVQAATMPAIVEPETTTDVETPSQEAL